MYVIQGVDNRDYDSVGLIVIHNARAAQFRQQFQQRENASIDPIASPGRVKRKIHAFVFC
jgi:hypothetical protein